MKKTMRTATMLITTLLLLVMVAGCSNAPAKEAEANAPAEEVEYQLPGNYVYVSEDGSSIDANGATWRLYIDSETKFHLVGVKAYEDNTASVRMDEGQVIYADQYLINCGFTPYMMFSKFVFHGNVNDEATAAALATQEEAINAYGDKTGNEFFQLQINRTSNDPLNSGTFSIVGDVDLSWGTWDTPIPESSDEPAPAGE